MTQIKSNECWVTNSRTVLQCWTFLRKLPDTFRYIIHQFSCCRKRGKYRQWKREISMFYAIHYTKTDCIYHGTTCCPAVVWGFLVKNSLLNTEWTHHSSSIMSTDTPQKCSVMSFLDVDTNVNNWLILTYFMTSFLEELVHECIAFLSFNFVTLWISTYCPFITFPSVDYFHHEL